MENDALPRVCFAAQTNDVPIFFTQNADRKLKCLVDSLSHSSVYTKAFPKLRGIANIFGMPIFKGYIIHYI